MADTVIDQRSHISESLPKMTYEEFLDWANDTHAEWVDGEVVWMSPVSYVHQKISRFLFRLLCDFADAKQCGEVLSDSFQMKTASGLPGREPDILFVASEHLSRIKANHLEGPADMVVEIVSLESTERDRGPKFFEYEQGGVREYWLIDPLRMEADFYQLGTDGLYHPTALDKDGRYHSSVLPGVWIDPDWLWDDPLPIVADVKKLWGIA